SRKDSDRRPGHQVHRGSSERLAGGSRLGACRVHAAITASRGPGTAAPGLPELFRAPPSATRFFRMKRRVVITGLGVVTSLSCGVEDLWKRICAGESGVHELTTINTSKVKIKFGGDVRDWDAEKWPDAFQDKKEIRRVDRFTQFAMVAGYDAVKDSGIDFGKENPHRCGVILGSGIGGLHEIEEQVVRMVEKGPDRVSPFLVPKMMLNAAGGNLSMRYGLKGVNYTVVTACASANNGIGDAFRTIQHGEADVMITGGTESSITITGL